MKAAWDRSEDILGRTKTRLDLCEGLAFGFTVCRCRNGSQHGWRKDFAKDVGRALLGRRVALPGPMGCCALAYNIHLLERLEEVRPFSELFFFFVKKESVALTPAVPFKPCVSAGTLKACALIGLHLSAAEDEAGSSGSQSPDSGDIWRYGCPKSPDWDSDVESWTESEGTCSSEQCEHNVESLALSVVEQDESGERCPFSWKIGNLRGWP